MYNKDEKLPIISQELGIQIRIHITQRKIYKSKIAPGHLKWDQEELFGEKTGEKNPVRLSH